MLEKEVHYLHRELGHLDASRPSDERTSRWMGELESRIEDLEERPRDFSEIDNRVAALASELDQVRGRFKKVFRESRSDQSNSVQALEHTLYPRLWADDIGADPRLIPLHRTIPLRVYVGRFDHTTVDKISAAVDDVARTLKFEIATDYPPDKASWYKRWVVRTKGVATQPEVAERLQKLEKAVEIQALGRPQAEVDQIHAGAAATLLDALPSDVPSAAQIGSILVIKIPGRGRMTRHSPTLS